MPYQQGVFPIIAQERLTADVYSVRLRCPGLASQALPGQFVHIRAEGLPLRRPISICECDGETIRLVFQIRGEGTRRLSALTPGSTMDVLGPLGNGYPEQPPEARVILAGGGIGVPPLLEAAKRCKNATALLGFRDKSAVILEQDFAAVCDTRVATDNGAYGLHGFVTDLLERRLAEGPADMVFACGPTPMLKGVGAVAEKNGLPIKISVEERMACGVGACLVCACRTVRDGRELYSHVCTDGPVFDGREVVFE